MDHSTGTLYLPFPFMRFLWTNEERIRFPSLIKKHCFDAWDDRMQLHWFPIIIILPIRDIMVRALAP